MSRIILNLLEKMGKWFGIIFKIIIPLLVMYRPIKNFAFSFVVFGTYYGTEAQQINKFGMIVFCILYAVFLILLLLFPKAASATVFVLIAYYFAFFVFAYIAGFYSGFFAGVSNILNEYAKAFPIVVLFLVGKVFFFFFVRRNYMSIAHTKLEKGNSYCNLEEF